MYVSSQWFIIFNHFPFISVVDMRLYLTVKFYFRDSAQHVIKSAGLTSLRLNFLIYKIEILILTSHNFVRIKWAYVKCLAHNIVISAMCLLLLFLYLRKYMLLGSHTVRSRGWALIWKELSWPRSDCQILVVWPWHTYLTSAN